MKEKPPIPKSPKQERSSAETQERDLRRISELVNDIEAHNKGYAWENIEPGEMHRGTPLGVPPSTHLDLVALQARHKDTLQSFGSSLVHEPSRDEELPMSGRLMLKITDGQKFVKRLKALEPIIRSTNPPMAFAPLLKDIEKQLYIIGLQETADQEQSVLSRLKEIVSYFHTVSPNLDFKTVDTYVRFNETGRLENYIAAERENLWDEPGEGFGPADWVRQMTADELAKRWQRAVNILHREEARGQAGVASELREHLVKCIVASAEIVEEIGDADEDKHRVMETLAHFSRQLRGTTPLN